jgi:hypothetical protein
VNRGLQSSRNLQTQGNNHLHIYIPVVYGCHPPHPTNLIYFRDYRIPSLYTQKLDGPFCQTSTGNAYIMLNQQLRADSTQISKLMNENGSRCVIGVEIKWKQFIKSNLVLSGASRLVVLSLFLLNYLPALTRRHFFEETTSGMTISPEYSICNKYRYYKLPHVAWYKRMKQRSRSSLWRYQVGYICWTLGARAYWQNTYCIPQYWLHAVCAHSR